MKLSSPEVTLSITAEELFGLLNAPEKYKTLMPDQLSKFEVLDSNRFLFALKGMPEIILVIGEQIPYSKIVLKSDEGKLPFELVGHIAEEGVSNCRVRLDFEGTFNPMMEMMIKKPINNFLQSLAENLSKLH